MKKYVITQDQLDFFRSDYGTKDAVGIVCNEIENREFHVNTPPCVKEALAFAKIVIHRLRYNRDHAGASCMLGFEGPCKLSCVDPNPATGCPFGAVAVGVGNGCQICDALYKLEDALRSE